ncbi:hypothetical protein [Flintibacter muris]|uniref:hypothetical protein n=1 Tax=Flintibacter muris TaxID=2941327 RepID=UPI00204229CF|nr:hypothetical protein [Flintibacter muris]
MKKLSFLLALALMAGLMIPAVHATPNDYQSTEVTYSKFGDFEIVTTTILYDLPTRSNARAADKTLSVKYSGNVIADVTLSATFGYDGETAWVSKTSSSHTTYSGWSYGSEKISQSGGTASLSGKLSHLLHGSHSVNISLTCSPTGQIS